MSDEKPVTEPVAGELQDGLSATAVSAGAGVIESTRADAGESTVLSTASAAQVDDVALAAQVDDADAVQQDPEHLLRTLISIRRLLFMLFLMSLGVMVFFARDIIMPITLGILIALTLKPPVRWLTRLKLPAALAAIVVVLAVGGVMGGGGYLLSEPMTSLFESIPDIGDRIKERIAPYRSTMEAFSEASEQVNDLAGVNDDETQRVVVDQPGLITSAASSVASGATSLTLGLILALFLLSTGDLFYEKIVAVMPVLSRKKKALRIIHDVEDNVSRYLFTISLINIGLGTVIGSLLFWWGIPNAMLWGVIAAVMNFLPFIGALIGASMLAAVSLGLSETLTAVIIPPAIYLACSTIEGNVVTPMIVGRRLELNVVAVFLAVALWGWLWGMAGALMAVPILVVLKVLCDHVEDWEPFGQFLSGRTAPTDYAL